MCHTLHSEYDENVIHAEHLTVTFQSRKSKRDAVLTAVSDLTLTLKRGERLAIVGESGSGKTTLLRTLLGLVPLSDGSVSLFGYNISTCQPEKLRELRQRCGYVPQDPYGALPPRLMALAAVTEPLTIAHCALTKTEMNVRARGLLAELGLADERILASRPVALSGGQRQRVELARALSLNPELLLCDEPTSMQDASTRGEIIDVLNRHVTERNMALVFVTHDLQLAARAAGRIMVMQHGRICEEGSADSILHSPQHPYTQALIAAIPHLPCRPCMNSKSCTFETVN